MCGICLLLSSSNSLPDYAPIQKRGPDYFHQVFFAFKQTKDSSCDAILSAAVLSLQRESKDEIVKMPIEVGDRSILMWNGEIFFGGFNENVSADCCQGSSDTLFLAKTLLSIEEECFSSSSSTFTSKKTQFSSKVASLFRNIGGPFSFIYFAGTFVMDDNRIKKPFFIFGRDVWGRRSLMVGKNSTSFMISSSVLPFANSANSPASFKKRTDAAFLESLPRENLFVHEINDDEISLLGNNNQSSLEIISPGGGMIYEEIKPDGIYEIVSSATGSDNDEANDSLPMFEFLLVAKYEDVVPDCLLSSSKQCPVRLHPLSDQARFHNHLSFLPMSCHAGPLDCIHDSFLFQIMDKTCESLRQLREVNDEATIGKLLEEIILNITLWIVEKTHWGPDRFQVELVEAMKNRFAPFITKIYVAPHEQTFDISSFTASFVYLTFLAVAVQRRTASWNTHSPPTNNSEKENIRNLLILFSGGIDCVVLAKLAAILTDPKDMAIDLINVSFGKDSEIHCLSSVDRISCLDSVKEILKVDEDHHRRLRKTRLLLADITGEEIIQHSAEIAIALLPKNTVMDTCIGAALYFGARGEGRLADVGEIMNQLTTTLDEKIENFVPKNIVANKANQRDDDDDDDDELIEENSNAESSSRFLPLLKCLIRHYVDRGLEEMSICLLGKEYTSAELVATNEKFGYKTLRAQAEAAASIGLIKIRGETYQTTTILPQVRQRIDETNENNQQPKNSKQCSLTGRNYYLSILNPECARFAQLMRQERLKLAGLSDCESDAKSASSQARVIIAGMGADESLGGYHRYCHKQNNSEKQQQEGDDLYQQKQHERLQTEMQRDFDRLWERNLGRDDRIMSSFGKEARFPFLDEALLFSLSGIVSWIESKSNAADISASTASVEVSNLFKDKNLLRFGAENILGIKKEIAFKPKKAIQFGTKIANRKNKGEQICL